MTEPAWEPDREPSRRRWPWWAIAFLSVALLVALGAALWLRQSTAVPPVAPTAVSDLRLSDTTPDATSGPTRRTALSVTGVFIEPGDGRAPLLDEIRAARRSIDLEVYIITDEIILEALEDAQRRGVEVRVILEEHPFGGGGGQEELFARLESAGIAVRWGNPVFRFTHVN